MVNLKSLFAILAMLCLLMLFAALVHLDVDARSYFRAPDGREWCRHIRQGREGLREKGGAAA
jgi:hypothetical protein